MEEIYHAHNGVDGYPGVTIYLVREGCSYSPATIHKYMNTELGVHSIVGPKKLDYEHGKSHKVFENKLKQDFSADASNQKSVPFSHICSKRTLMQGITAVSLTSMTGVP